MPLSFSCHPPRFFTTRSFPVELQAALFVIKSCRTPLVEVLVFQLSSRFPRQFSSPDHSSFFPLLFLQSLNLLWTETELVRAGDR